MMLLRSFVASVLLISSGPLLAAEPAATDAGASAPTSATAPAAVAPVPAAPKEKIICRTEHDIGSWVRGTRRCATAREWKKSSQAARDTTANIQAQKGAFNQ